MEVEEGGLCCTHRRIASFGCRPRSLSRSESAICQVDSDSSFGHLGFGRRCCSECTCERFHGGVVYRFALQQGLARMLRAPVAIVLQSVAFGFLHYRGGIPFGALGVTLTTMFGLA